MADALCGPSNPLQQFKQQTSLDRTLQQDRLTSRPSPSQGFRSVDPNAGLLDPEFEAFQAGLPISEFHQHHSVQPAFAGHSGSSAAPSWANDFQRMHISPPPPFQQQPQQNTPPATSAWAQGFSEHISQSAPRAQQTSALSPVAFQQRARYGYSGYQSQLAQQQPAFAGPGLVGKGKEAVQDAQFDDAAFERAFDEVFEQTRDDLMADAGMTSTSVLDQTELGDQDHGRAPSRQFARFIPEHNFAPDVVDQAQEQEQTQHTQQDDDDALAATAHDLLQKVENNQTDKFRNSQFLSLMRRLRDREVKVEGDKMVETADVAATSSSLEAVAANESTLTSDRMAALQRNASGLRFDNSEQRPSPLAGLAGGMAEAGVVDTRPPEYGVMPPQEPQMSLQQREKAVLHLRHRLQKGFLSRLQAPQESEMPAMAELFTQLESYENLEPSIMYKTKINKVLKAIVKLSTIPMDEQYGFKRRGEAMLEVWNKRMQAEKAVIPPQEQDNDAGRIDPRDGQEVVELLNRPGAVLPDVEMENEEHAENDREHETNADIGTSAQCPLPARVDMFASNREASGLGEMLYGPSGTLEAERDRAAHRARAEATGGEDTWEARVARIKARVAEITGRPGPSDFRT